MIQTASRTMLASFVVLAAAFVLPACSNSGPSGGAPSPDSDAGGPVTRTVSLSPAAQRIIDAIARLAANQSADLDGDGVPEIQVSVGPSGVVEWKLTALGVVTYDRTYDPSTDTAISRIDADRDGFAESRTTRQESRRVIEKDTDGDQQYDWRQTDTYDWTASTLHTLIETAPQDDGNYGVVSDQTTPLRQRKCPPKPDAGAPEAGETGDAGEAGGDAGPTCQPTFPTGGPNDKLGYDRVGTYDNYGDADGSDGSCSAAHADKLQRAFDCAIQRIQTCLAATNNEEYRRMGEALATGNLHLSCGDFCDDGQASTTSEASVGGPHADMSWNATSLDAMSDDEACSSMLHEMMHWAQTEPGADHDTGDDRIYSCGRFCGGSKGCTYTGANTPKNCDITPPGDCAACAGTLDEKTACGFKTVWLAAEVDDPSPCGRRSADFQKMCRVNGLTGDYRACTQTLGQYMTACDGTKMECYSLTPCCLDCTEGTNTFPCPAGAAVNAPVIGGLGTPDPDLCAMPLEDICK